MGSSPYMLLRVLPSGWRAASLDQRPAGWPTIAHYGPRLNLPVTRFSLLIGLPVLSAWTRSGSGVLTAPEPADGLALPHVDVILRLGDDLGAAPRPAPGGARIIPAVLLSVSYDSASYLLRAQP